MFDDIVHKACFIRFYKMLNDMFEMLFFVIYLIFMKDFHVNYLRIILVSKMF